MLASNPGCSFNESGVEPDPPVDAPSPDAPIPDAPPVCTAGQPYCEGDVLMTCDANGSGPVDEGQPCFICDESGDAAECLYPSNVPIEAYVKCAATTHELRPPAGSTVNITKPAGDRIVILCGDDCGNGANTIEASHVVTNEGAWFCLSMVDIPGDVIVEVAVDPTTGHQVTIAEPIIWLVNDTVTIAGTVDLSGGRGVRSSVRVGGGPGGPGGFAGGDQAMDAGEDGAGLCSGKGGGHASNKNGEAGGGGGGGGFGGEGGMGGMGKSGDGVRMAAGGAGGGTCPGPELIPLRGGSGGGGGGDGDCAGCGWPGGGGGGALGISARGSIAITGRVIARGGSGFGDTSNLSDGQGGGGGGGAGGALLLEAQNLNVTGMLVVDGGTGGSSAAGDGGPGATAESLAGSPGANAATDGTGNGDGGAGGGGGGGRIRLNTPDGSFQCNSSFASPAGSCSAGRLKTELMP